jgi:hypothetical protein
MNKKHVLRRIQDKRIRTSSRPSSKPLPKTKATRMNKRSRRGRRGNRSRNAKQMRAWFLHVLAALLAALLSTLLHPTSSQPSDQLQQLTHRKGA